MATKLDAVCVALTALWTTTFASSTMRVVDSMQANADPTADWLFVCYDGDEPDDSTEGASADQVPIAGGNIRREDGEITCAVVAVLGGTIDIPAVRARALAVVDDCEDALRADKTLGGLVMQAHLTAQRFIPMKTDKGSKGRVVFTVSYTVQL